MIVSNDIFSFLKAIKGITDLHCLDLSHNPFNETCLMGLADSLSHQVLARLHYLLENFILRYRHL
jgi:Ran GTPase-activating protein (RanGAP) involved in mRNA processing and transport